LDRCAGALSQPLGHYSIFGSSGIVPALDWFAPFHSSKFFTMGLRLHDGSRVVGIILASPITIQSDDGPNTYFSQELPWTCDALEFVASKLEIGVD
jgi:hypothetical protein